jgi:hypothetical protein
MSRDGWLEPRALLNLMMGDLQLRRDCNSVISVRRKPARSNHGDEDLWHNRQQCSAGHIDAL